MDVRPSKGGKLRSFHSFTNWLMPWWVPGAANLDIHSYYPLLSWRRAVGLWGKVVGRSVGAGVPEHLRRNWPGGCGVFLSAVLHGPQEELPPGAHTGRWLKRFNN